MQMKKLKKKEIFLAFIQGLCDVVSFKEGVHTFLSGLGHLAPTLPGSSDPSGVC